MLPESQKIGDLWFRDFDQGMVLTLGAVLVGDNYYLPMSLVPGVNPPLFTEFTARAEDIGKPMPGIPFIFANPSDSTTRYVLPCIRVRREDPSPALERYSSISPKYRIPAAGAEAKTVNYRNLVLHGYDKYEEQENSFPYDIPYTITCEAAGRGARNKAHILLKHCMKRYSPHGVVTVVDSEGAERKYWVFGEGPSDLSIVGDIRDRSIIFGLSLRVKGYIDLKDPISSKVVTSEMQVSTNMKEQ